MSLECLAYVFISTYQWISAVHVYDPSALLPEALAPDETILLARFPSPCIGPCATRYLLCSASPLSTANGSILAREERNSQQRCSLTNKMSPPSIAPANLP